MRHRLLGKTGLKVSEVGFGGIPIIRLSMSEAILVLRRAQERGITLFDTANVYLDSEEKMGRAFQGLRPHVVLATKSIKRDRLGLEGDLEQSLRLLKTDYLDLFQLHQVSRGGFSGAVRQRRRPGSRPAGQGSRQDSAPGDYLP